MPTTVSTRAPKPSPRLVLHCPRSALKIAAVSRAASRFPFQLACTVLGWLATAALYRAMGHRALHGFDVHYLLRVIDAGEGISGRHVLYVPAARAVKRLLGLEPYDAMLVTSAAFVALGVVSVYWACRLARATNAQAWVATVMAASLPGVLHFATVAEINGLAFGMESLAWVVFFAVIRAKSPAALALGFVAVGATTGLSAGLHAIGHLQPLVFALVLLVGIGPGRFGARLGWIAITLAAHAFINWASVSGIASAQEAIDRNSTVVRNLAPWVTADQVPRILWQEWLYPLAPLSVLFLVGARSRERTDRRLTLAVGLCAIASWGVSLILLGPLYATERYLPGQVLAEFGAYVFYLIVPGTLIIARTLPLRGAAAIAALTVILGLLHWHSWKRADYREELAAAIRSQAEHTPSHFLVGGHDELTPLVQTAPQTHYRSVYELALELLRTNEQNPAAATLWFDFEFAKAQAEGATWHVTPGALQQLDADPLPALNQLADHLRKRYALRPIPEAQGLQSVQPRRN